MAYQVLARKYRPQRFSDVAGQDHVTRTLLNALAQNRIAHGYIFSGHRGIGKTTIARILAMALNCRTAIGTPERPSAEPCEVCDSCTEIRAGNAVDVIEIDAATNRGIDEIRELRDAARYRPARDRYKIYILDEAHQITDAAFNALLKTLEEPPDHVVFMMATTQPEDIPQTIRSRSQHFSFHAVSFEDILKELRTIADKEGVGADETALALLAEAGDGSMRDALSIMDQAIASAPQTDGRAELSAEQIRELMGTVPNTVFEKLLEQISESNSAAVMEAANALLNAGNSASQIARQFVRYLRNALMAKLGGEATPLLEISSDERARAWRSSLLFSEEDLTRFLQLMLRTFDELNYRQEPRFHLELGLMKLVHSQRLLPIEELLSQLSGKSSGPGTTSTAVPRPHTTAQTTAPAITPGTSPFRQAMSSSAGPISSPATRPASSARPAPAVQQEPPSFSPFEADRNRKRGGEQGLSTTATHQQPAELASPAESPMPVAARSTPSPSAAPNRQQDHAALAVMEAPAIMEEAPIEEATSPSELEVLLSTHTSSAADAIPLPAIEEEEAAQDPTSQTGNPAVDSGLATDGQLETIRAAVVEALDRDGHHTAAVLLGDGKWREQDQVIEVEIGAKKIMLGLLMNSDADKSARAALRVLGERRRLVVVAGEAGTPSGSSRRPTQGSVEAQARENPLVKQAQELFRAEVRTVLDLRDK